MQPEEQTEVAQREIKVGQIVLYSMPAIARYPGAVRPFLVTQVWDKQLGMVNGELFPDRSNDGEEYAAGPKWLTSIHRADTLTPGYWSWESAANPVAEVPVIEATFSEPTETPAEVAVEAPPAEEPAAAMTPEGEPLQEESPAPPTESAPSA